MGSKESLPINSNGIRNELGRDSLYERTISFLEREARSAIVISEGPPIYLWPDNRYPAQRWDSLEFEAGWKLISDVAARVSYKFHHFYLIDEFNRY